jgi:regulator of sigma E protease
MIQFVLNTFVFLGSFALVLGVLVFFHELGHYSVARLFNVSVERFSVGFGKPIIQWRAKSGTHWSIGRIPLGGYVKFMGDASAASNPDQEQLDKIKADMSSKDGADAWKTCLHFKPLWQRTLVTLAGPVANFILAAFIYMSLALMYGTYTLKAKVSEVNEGGVAQLAGVMVGDEFVTINGKDAREVTQVQSFVALSTGDKLDVVVQRDGHLKNLVMIPQRRTRTDAVGGKVSTGMVGITFANEFKVKKYGVIEAAQHGIGTVYSSIAGTGKYIGRIFKGKEDGKALGSIVKIAAITGKVGMDAANSQGNLTQKLERGFRNLLALAAALSVGLGFANLMPIPVLDGGHLLYYGYEAVMRRPLSARAQEIGFRIGFTVLLTLFLVLTWNDIGYVPDLFKTTG